MPDVLEVRDVTKSFDTGAGRVDVLAGVSFDVAPDRNVAVLGPSGSGKSTLLHLVGTLDRPSSGTIRIGDVTPHDLPEPELAAFRNGSIGFVFQDHHLLPQYTVLENVLLPTLAFPGDRDADTARARDLLERVGLAPRLGHRPAQLSGGERQRVAVARAMIRKPSVLLCDEPTGSLDHRSAGTIADLLFELHRAEGAILIAVTHSLELAGRFDRRLELREGTCFER